MRVGGQFSFIKFAHQFSFNAMQCRAGRNDIKAEASRLVLSHNWHHPFHQDKRAGEYLPRVYEDRAPIRDTSRLCPEDHYPRQAERVILSGPGPER